MDEALGSETEANAKCCKPVFILKASRGRLDKFQQKSDVANEKIIQLLIKYMKN